MYELDMILTRAGSPGEGSLLRLVFDLLASLPIDRVCKKTGETRPAGEFSTPNESTYTEIEHTCSTETIVLSVYLNRVKLPLNTGSSWLRRFDGLKWRPLGTFAKPSTTVRDAFKTGAAPGALLLVGKVNIS